MVWSVEADRSDSVPVLRRGLKRPCMFLLVPVAPIIITKGILPDSHCLLSLGHNTKHQCNPESRAHRGLEPNHTLSLKHQEACPAKISALPQPTGVLVITRNYCCQPLNSRAVCYAAIVNQYTLLQCGFCSVWGWRSDSRERMVLGSSDQDITTELM